MAVPKSVSLPEETQAQLAKIAAVGYTVSGLAPTASKWDLTEGQVCDVIKELTKGYLDDVETVTLDWNKRNGAVYAYVWLPKDSKHLRDRELQQGNSAINKALNRYSPKMKEFMDKFCLKDRRRTIPETSGMPLAGIEVDIGKFLQLQFDEHGTAYGKLVGDQFRRNTIVRLKPMYTKGRDGQYDKLSYIQVTKSLKTRGAGGRPQPKRSFNG